MSLSPRTREVKELWELKDREVCHGTLTSGYDMIIAVMDTRQLKTACSGPKTKKDGKKERKDMRVGEKF